MTIDEFSYEFDVLASSYYKEGGFTMSDSSILAFNEYEKSVFLTREQESLVIALYSGNGSYGGFEVTEQVRRDLDNLLADDELTPLPVIGEQESDDKKSLHIKHRSQFFKLPPDLWYIVYEAGHYETSDGNDMNCPTDKDGVTYNVEILPVAYDDFHRVSQNPFRGPSKRRALRVDKGKFTNNYVEIIPKFNLDKYYVKYIRRPQPIILAELGDLTINGQHEPSGCTLHETLHRLILENAVRAALSSRIALAAKDNQS